MSNLLSFGSSSQTSAPLANFLGRPLTDAQGSISALKQSGSAVRVLPPGSMTTMDYNASRINVVLDKSGNITRTYQG